MFGIEYTGSYHPDVLASRRDVELACLVDSATNTTVVLDERDSEVAHSWFSLATIASIVAILIAGAHPLHTLSIFSPLTLTSTDSLLLASLQHPMYSRATSTAWSRGPFAAWPQPARCLTASSTSSRCPPSPTPT